MEEEGENTVTCVILEETPGSVQLFKSTSGKNSPVLNSACSTAKQAKAPQNTQSQWSFQLLRLKVFPPEHHKWDKLHNKIIRALAERCNHKIKGPFKILVELVIIQERNIKKNNSKVPASSCYRETQMAECQRSLLSLRTDFPMSLATALFLLSAAVVLLISQTSNATIHKVAICSFLQWKPNFNLVRFTAEKNKDKTVACSSLCFNWHGMYLIIWVRSVPDKRGAPPKRVLVKSGSLPQKARPEKNQMRT